jgi:hypothetical protein
MRLINEQAPDETTYETDSTSASSSIWCHPIVDAIHPRQMSECEQLIDSDTTDWQHLVNYVYKGTLAVL